MIDCPAAINPLFSPTSIAVRDIRTHIRAVRGGSCSHLVLADDGCLYIAKFAGNPQHSRVLVNEWLSTYIARRLNLPVPTAAILRLSAEVHAESPGLSFSIAGRAAGYCPGLHYGSKYVGLRHVGNTTRDYLPESLIDNVVNITDFIGALVFDKWVCNADGRQAVFERLKGGDLYRATFIDHGNCFGAATWQLTSAPLQGLYARLGVYSYVYGSKAFEPWITRASQINEDDLHGVLQQTPDCWWPGKRCEGEQLITALLARRDTILDQILQLRSTRPSIFPSW